MKIFRYLTISFLTLGIYSQSYAQQYEYEKRKRDWKPSELFFAADVVGLARLISGDVQTEFQTKIDFDQFYFALDMGVSNLNSSGDGFDYSSSGYFFRVGPQANLIPYNKNRSSIYFGLMYAQANFSDDISYNLQENAWGNQQLAMKNRDMTARWMEASMGIQARVYGPIYMGYVIRFKMAKTLSGDGTLQPYEIPGFGQSSKNTNFGFNYYIIYRLGFRKKEIPLRPKKVKISDSKDQ